MRRALLSSSLLLLGALVFVPTPADAAVVCEVFGPGPYLDQTWGACEIPECMVFDEAPANWVPECTGRWQVFPYAACYLYDEGPANWVPNCS